MAGRHILLAGFLNNTTSLRSRPFKLMAHDNSISIIPPETLLETSQLWRTYFRGRCCAINSVMPAADTLPVPKPEPLANDMLPVVR